MCLADFVAEETGWNFRTFKVRRGLGWKMRSVDLPLLLSGKMMKKPWKTKANPLVDHHLSPEIVYQEHPFESEYGIWSREWICQATGMVKERSTIGVSIFARNGDEMRRGPFGRWVSIEDQKFTEIPWIYPSVIIAENIMCKWGDFQLPRLMTDDRCRIMRDTNLRGEPTQFNIRVIQNQIEYHEHMLNVIREAMEAPTRITSCQLRSFEVSWRRVQRVWVWSSTTFRCHELRGKSGIY